MVQQVLPLGLRDDLEKSIRRFQEAVARTPWDCSERAIRLAHLGTSLYTRFERYGDPQDIENAIQATEAAVKLTAKDHPDRAGLLGNLSCQLCMRFQRFDALADLETAI